MSDVGKLSGSSWEDYRDLYREEMNAMRQRIVQQRVEIYSLRVLRARDAIELSAAQDIIEDLRMRLAGEEQT